MTRLELNDEEAILLHGLGVYASARIKPPLDTDQKTIDDLREIAESIVIAAPAEVMQGLAVKLRALTPTVATQRRAIIEKWNKARI
jgi:hypothetical protein